MDNPRHIARALVWMRRALRVDDNAALWHACQDADEVIPLLVLSEDERYGRDSPRRRFVLGAIAALDETLRERGAHLHLRFGPPEREIAAACHSYNADAVYAARIYDRPAIERDTAIERELLRSGKRLVLINDRVLREPEEVRTVQGAPYRVFTPYKRRWLEMSGDVPRSFPDVGSLASVPFGSQSIPVERALPNGARGVDSGERAATRRLHEFLSESIMHYDSRRDIPGIDGTSKLSPHLALGTISPRRVYWGAQEILNRVGQRARSGVATFVSELIWREFYYQILTAFPEVLRGSFRTEFRGIRWRRADAAFNRWKAGLTGYPIVDAAMRQLKQEGWMHNRARMIVASFLTKDLHVDWRRGERYFMEHLLDADVASNNGGWQWAAGTGTDASPWFRIFNPVLQGKKFDPQGSFVRRYVPELATVPDSVIHEPWRMTQQDQENAGFRVGRSYPAKIIEHAEERAVTIALYSAVSRTQGKS
jgi:deoxyribodipyrimidine photo-lyase